MQIIVELGVIGQEQPNKVYFILRAHRIFLEADLSIQVIMKKLQSYKARIVFNFEGFQYQLGDFRLTVGNCVPSTSKSLRGIMMEVLRNARVGKTQDAKKVPSSGCVNKLKTFSKSMVLKRKYATLVSNSIKRIRSRIRIKVLQKKKKKKNQRYK